MSLLQITGNWDIPKTIVHGALVAGFFFLGYKVIVDDGWLFCSISKILIKAHFLLCSLMWENPVCKKFPNFLHHGIDKWIHQKLFQSWYYPTNQELSMCEGHFWLFLTARFIIYGPKCVQHCICPPETPIPWYKKLQNLVRLFRLKWNGL